MTRGAASLTRVLAAVPDAATVMVSARDTDDAPTGYSSDGDLTYSPQSHHPRPASADVFSVTDRATAVNGVEAPASAPVLPSLAAVSQ